MPGRPRRGAAAAAAAAAATAEQEQMQEQEQEKEEVEEEEEQEEEDSGSDYDDDEAEAEAEAEAEEGGDEDQEQADDDDDDDSVVDDAAKNGEVVLGPRIASVPVSAREGVVFDLCRLTAYDARPVDEEVLQAEYGGSVGTYFGRRAQEGVQELVAQLFSLEAEQTSAGPVALLPGVEESFKATQGLGAQIPRERPPPEQRTELTRWEKFAAEKGIQKRKKNRMAWDEAHQEWKPRYGYRRANAGIEEHGIVEVKSGEDPMQDPWAEARQKKAERVQKNARQRSRNLAQLQRAQQSTASLGRFDRKLAGEPTRKLAGKRKRYESGVRPVSSDKESMRSALRAVMVRRDKKKQGNK